MGIGNAAAGIEIVLLTVVNGHPMSVGFGNTVRVTRSKGGTLVLGRFIRLTKDLTTRSLVKFSIRLATTNRF